MAAYTKQSVSLGTAPTGTGGDDNRAAFTKVNANFDALYNTFEIDAAAYTAIKVNGSEKARFTASGSFYVGTTDNPSTTNGVSVNSNGTIKSVSQDGCTIARISSDGEVVTFLRTTTTVGSISVTSSSTTYNTSSDYRLKENAVEISDAIDRLMALKPYRFNFIVDPNKIVDGFFAHEAAEVVPEAITGEKDAVDDDSNPVYQGIDQSKLVPLLTAALQAAVSQIAALETRVTALEA